MSDYIDRKAEGKQFHKLILNFYSAYEKDGKDERLAALLEIVLAARSAINAIPAADVAEVRHGRWCMLSYDEAVCTCCGYNRNTPFESTKEAKEKWNELPPFCEMCGAKMDERSEDNV